MLDKNIFARLFPVLARPMGSSEYVEDGDDIIPTFDPQTGRALSSEERMEIFGEQLRKNRQDSAFASSNGDYDNPVTIARPRDAYDSKLPMPFPPLSSDDPILKPVQPRFEMPQGAYLSPVESSEPFAPIAVPSFAGGDKRNKVAEILAAASRAGGGELTTSNEIPDMPLQPRPQTPLFDDKYAYQREAMNPRFGFDSLRQIDAFPPPAEINAIDPETGEIILPEGALWKENQPEGIKASPETRIAQTGTLGYPEPEPPLPPGYEDYLHRKRMETDPNYAANWRLNDLITNKKKHTEDRDKSFGKRLREVLSNFLEGMAISSRNNPNAPWQAILAGGGTGAVGGLVNRRWNEQRQYERDIAEAKGEYGVTRQIAEDEEQIAALQSKSATDVYKAMTDRNEKNEKAKMDWIEVALKELKEKGDIDLNDEQDKRWVESYEQKYPGMKVGRRIGDSKFQLQIPNRGAPIIFDTKTGAYKEAVGNYAKPRSFSEKDVSPIEFGIYDDDQIKEQATANIAKNSPGITFRPEIVAALPAGAKNPDGTFNLAGFSALKAVFDPGVEGVSLSNIIKEMPSDYEQMRSKEEGRIRRSQGGLRKQFTRFNSILNNRTPSQDATPITLKRAKELFKNALTKSPKELEQFFELLQNADVQ